LIEEHLLEDIRGLSAAVVSDAMPTVGVLPASIIPQIPVETVVVGPAYTVKLPSGDNLGIHIAIAEAPRSSVIVAHVNGDAEFGIWGEIASTAASEADLTGFVTNSFVRDAPELTRIGFPVFARGRSVRKAHKQSPGVQQVPLRFGDTWVRSGDVVVADSDGVVFIPRGRVAEVVSDAKQILAEEQNVVAGLREGKTTLELLNLVGLVAGNERRTGWNSDV